MNKREKDEWVAKILTAIGIEKMSLTEEQLDALRDVVEELHSEGYNDA